MTDKCPFADVADDIRDFIGNRPVIAHNVSFDKRFLNAEFKRAGVRTLHRNKSYCTMRRYQAFNDGLRKGSSLDAVVESMGVEGRRGTVHEAGEDARLAWQVACVFYMMDNHIPIPGGKPVSPSRKDSLDDDDDFLDDDDLNREGFLDGFLDEHDRWAHVAGKQQSGKSGLSTRRLVGAVFVIGLLAWWFFEALPRVG